MRHGKHVEKNQNIITDKPEIVNNEKIDVSWNRAS